jgi:hypothetical protein
MATIVLSYTLLVLLSPAVTVTAFVALWFAYLAGAFALWAAIGVVGLLGLLARHRPRDGVGVSPFRVIADWLDERLRRDRGASLLWPPLLFATLMAAFNCFKQLILVDAGFALDPAFAAIDRAVFLGHEPWRITHALFAHPLASWAIDKAYHGWFLPMSVGVLLCAWLPAGSFRLRTQYLLTYIGVWIALGSGLAYLLPGSGPWYVAAMEGSGSTFAPLLQQLGADQDAARALIDGAKLDALANQAMLLRMLGQDTPAIGAGISAMPSVHNALAVLFALGAARIDRRAGWLMWGYAAIIWIGSIHLGWHYAIDGIVAAVLTIGLWRVAGAAAARLERPIFASPTGRLAPAT